MLSSNTFVLFIFVVVSVILFWAVFFHRRFLNLLMVLEILTLICLQVFFISHNFHSVVFILVLGVAEAAVGLSLLVWLSRSGGVLSLCVFFS